MFVMVNQNAQIKQLEAESKKAQDKANQVEDTPPVAREGFKMVPHGDHWHEVPIDAPDTWQGEPHGEVVTRDDMPIQTYDGPLTYHAELLETNPVKALRLQAEERGHWSKDHIPPFPPSDAEAQEFAKNIYLMHYYTSIDDGSKYGDASRGYNSQLDAIDDQFSVADPVTAREMDLWRLTWTFTAAREITPYGGMTRFGRARMFASDYFPAFIDANGNERKLTPEDFQIEGLVRITE